MKRNVRIITLATVLIVVLVATIVTVTVFASTQGDRRSSKGFTVETSGNTCTITKYDGTDETVNIPAKISGKRVVKVAAGAFTGKTVKELIFSDDIKELTLDEGAFAAMTGLDYVRLPAAMKEISKQAFKGCTGLTHIVLPEALTAIGEEAFSGCTKLAYSYTKSQESSRKDDTLFLPDTLETVGKNAFYNCYIFQNTSFGSKLKTIGEGAFSKCSALRRIAVAENCALESIGKDAFAGCTRLTSTETEPLVFPALKTIGETAFSATNSNFKYLELPATVESVGDGAFQSSSIETLVFADDFNPKTFGKGVFRYCKDLSVVTTVSAKGAATASALPEKMTAIPELTFAGCYKLLNRRDFVIGAQIETIGNGAFSLYDYNSSDTSRTLYTKYQLTVHADNEKFKTVALENFQKRNTTEPEKLRHSLLMSADGSRLIAYIGTYSTYNVTDKEGEDYDCYRDNDTQKTAFTFLDNPEVRDDLTTIASYAFAGVRFDRILMVPHISKVESNAFHKSSINVVLFASADCTLEEDAFAQMPDDLGVFVEISVQSDHIRTQVEEMIADGLKAEYGKMSMFD